MGRQLKTVDLIQIAFFAVILALQEFFLSALPNLQLTFLLIIVFAKTLGSKRTVLIIFVYILLDNLLAGSFNLIFMPFAFVALSLVPLLLNTVFKRYESPIALSLFAILFAFIYCWILIIPGASMFELSWQQYLIADLLFELLLAASSCLSVLWLYQPLANVLRRQLKITKQEKDESDSTSGSL